MYTDKTTKVLLWKIFCVLALNSLIGKAVGSSRTEFVCIGDQLTLTCSTNGSAIEWSFTHPHLVTGLDEQVISSNSRANLGPFLTSLGVFRYSRTSTSPLISVLQIDNITANLNGTRLECAYSEGMTTTTIYVIENVTAPKDVIVTVLNEKFESENIKVNLTWTQEDNVAYNVTTDIIPHASFVQSSEFNQSIVVELTLSYNIIYNVSITVTAAVTAPCRLSQTSPNFIQLNYVKCGYPLDLPMVRPAVRDSMAIHGYSDPALVGTVVNISCPFGNVLTESNTTVITCMENGEWEPHPTRMRCRVNCGALSVANDSNIIIDYNSTLEDSVLQWRCKEGLSPTDEFEAICHHSGSWIPDTTRYTCNTITSSVLDQNAVTAVVLSVFIVFILSSIFIFIVGYVCGRFGTKRNQLSPNEGTASDETIPPLHSQSTPLYEDVLPNPTTKVKDFELKDNVAYGTAKPK